MKNGFKFAAGWVLFHAIIGAVAAAASTLLDRQLSKLMKDEPELSPDALRSYGQGEYARFTVPPAEKPAEEPE